LRDRLSAENYDVDFIPDAACTYTPTSTGEKRNSVLITTGAEFDRETDLHLGKRILQHCETAGLRPIVLTKAWEHFRSLRSDIWRLGGEFHEFSELTDAEKITSRCRYHIGGRYHMAIFCACLDIPSFLIKTNTHKNLWLAQEVKGISYLESVQFSDDEISAKVSAIAAGEVQKSMLNMAELHFSGISRLVQNFKKAPAEKYSTPVFSDELFSRIRSRAASGLMRRIFSGE
jgi:polysaccharide pyruvyl transferase WcaK-like protein